MLPGRRRVGAGFEPAAPLILAAWNFATNEDKAARLAEHIMWAHEHAALPKIDSFLRGLPEDGWCHEWE
tara:strand:- start:199 stop:405 length:207 start_codon:yes stop_codon:yes gene_type:complete